MKKSLLISAVIGTFLFCMNTFAQSLEFSKSIVDSYKQGSASVKATMIMDDGKKHSSSVQLQNDVAVKDLADGNLIYVKDHHEIFQVTGSRTESDGKQIVDIKSTNLYIVGKKTESKKMDNMKNQKNSTHEHDANSKYPPNNPT